MNINSADQAFVRETNLSLVLRLIHTQPPVSRAQLAVMTGLNKSTVSSLVDELLQRTLIHETGINSIGAGRPATLLEINPQAGCIIGVELGVDFVSVALTDFLANILWRDKQATDPLEDQQQMIGEAFRMVRDAMAAAKAQNKQIVGLGLATPGTVDLAEGVLIFAPNLQWRNVPFGKLFTDELKLKVFVENDANAAAVAEHLFGSARDSHDFLFVFAGVGIGGGLFLNGKLYRGKNGYAGEIGHSPIMADLSETICHCGNRGCWETYANQGSIVHRMESKMELQRADATARVIEEAGLPLTIEVIKEAADAGDLDAQLSFAEAGRAMGQGFAGLVNIFNPEKIILGGPLSIAGDYLLPAIRESVSRHSLPEIEKHVEVLLSPFGPDASLIGAIAIVVDDVLAHPMILERR